jgi:circadian clock protein KaiC
VNYKAARAAWVGKHPVGRPVADLQTVSDSKTPRWTLLMKIATSLLPRANTGVSGLDFVLGGGLARNRLHLLEGSPGTGKTTIALEFLMAGAESGEAGIYVSLAETEEELREGAKSHGWTLDPLVEVFELIPPESVLDPEQHQSLLYSSDLELGETVKRIFEAIERLKPKRVVIDSLSEIRLLAQSSLRYRRQVLALKHYFARHQSTVLMLDDLTTESTDRAVHSIAHSVIHLDQLAPIYGGERRRLRVVKCRGQPFRNGYHDFTIATGGVKVFPRLVAAEHRRNFAGRLVKSGVAELDALLGGGLAAGSSTLIIGPAGTGKSLMILQYLAEAIRRGERAALFVFDEELGLLFERAKALGIDLASMQDANMLFVEQMDAAELSPGEFLHRARAAVERDNITAIAIDSLNGYHAAMPEEQFLTLHLHELLQYLNRRGATTFLSIAQHGMVGEMRQNVDVTYLADTVIMLRFFEAFGRVRRALSVVKKRTGPHEDTIREFRIGSGGLTVGEPLQEFQGVLRGVPEYVGKSAPLMGKS